jgi:YHS domain-containing protein
MKPFVNFLCVLTALTALTTLFTVQTIAQTGEKTDKTLSTEKPEQLAIGGYDAVAYFSDSKAVQGKAEFTHVWKDLTWRFASAEHREMFKSNPDNYAPQYGGHCAYAVCKKNALFAADPTVWKIVQGKLYLNYNAKTAEMWAKEPLDKSIMQGDEHWKTLKSRTNAQ